MNTFSWCGKNYRVFQVASFDETINIFFRPQTYAHPSAKYSLAVEAMCIDEDGLVEPWGIVTVNLGNPLQGSEMAFADTNNNPWLLDLVSKEGLADIMPYKQQSGFCTYPLLQWYVEKFTV